jgi:hypothetical protein
MLATIQGRMARELRRRQRTENIRSLSEQTQRSRLSWFRGWLLSPAGFPMTHENHANTRHRESHLKRIQRIRGRLEQEAHQWPDYRLTQAVGLLSEYAGVAEKTFTRRSADGYMTVQSSTKAEVEISERILAAVLISKRLEPDIYPFRTVHGMLAARSYFVGIRALEQRVSRLRKQIEAKTHLGCFETLKTLYSHFLWSYKHRAGFSEPESMMLKHLCPAACKSTSDGRT